MLYLNLSNIKSVYIGEKKMAAKAKKLCDWKSQDITKKLDKFSDIVRNPQFVCAKCGRVADKKKWLHKPTALK
jgi:hypothetical protein